MATLLLVCPAGVENKTGELGWGFRLLLCKNGVVDHLHLIGLL